MNKEIDNELKVLNRERHNLHRMESKGMINEDYFIRKIEPLNKRAMELIHEFIESDLTQRKETEKIIDAKRKLSEFQYAKEKEEKRLRKKLKKTTFINDCKLQNNNKNISIGGNNKMVEENIKEKKVSNASLIIKALQMKSIKDFDAVAAKVVEQKPTADVKKIKRQAIGMVKELIAGKRIHSKLYDWNPDTFLLTKKVIEPVEKTV